MLPWGALNGNTQYVYHTWIDSQLSCECDGEGVRVDGTGEAARVSGHHWVQDEVTGEAVLPIHVRIIPIQLLRGGCYVSVNIHTPYRDTH